MIFRGTTDPITQYRPRQNCRTGDIRDNRCVGQKSALSRPSYSVPGVRGSLHASTATLQADCAWLKCGLFRCTLCASLLSRGALVVRDSPPKIRSIMCRAARRNASILSGRSAASGVFASIVTGTVPHRCISHTDSRSFIDTRKSARHTAVDTVSFRLLPLPGE